MRTLSAVGAELEAMADLVVRHNRRQNSGRGRPIREAIDHLVVAPSGIWVIDAKTHYGPLEVRRSGGILTPRDEQLFINNRDRTALVDTLRRQVAAVAVAVGADGVPVQAALCFVDSAVPWVSESIGGVRLVDLPSLRLLVQQEGPLGDDRRTAVAAVLDARFAAA